MNFEKMGTGVSTPENKIDRIDSNKPSNEVIDHKDQENFKAFEESKKREDDQRASEIRSEIDSMNKSEEKKSEVSPTKALELEIMKLKSDDLMEAAENMESIVDNSGEVATELLNDPMILREKGMNNGSFDMTNYISRDPSALENVREAISKARSTSDMKSRNRSVAGGIASGAAGIFGGTSLASAGYIGLATVAPWAGLAGIAGFGAYHLYKKFRNRKKEEGRYNALSSISRIFKK